MKRTLGYLKPYSSTVAWGLVIKFMGALSELFLPFILDYIIDEVAPQKSVSKIVLYGLVMLAFSISAIVCNIVANRMSARSAGAMTHDIRYDLFTKTTNLQADQVDGFTMPSLVSRLTSDTYYINQMVARSLRLGVRAPILLIGGLIFCFIIDVKLALVLLACVPIVTIAMVIITKKSISVYFAVQKSGDGVVRAAQENITGVRVIKALSKSDYEVEKFSGVNDELTKREFRANKLTALTNPFATLVLNIGLVIVILFGARLGSSSGDVLAYLSYFTIILNAMLGLSKIFVEISRGVASAGRVEKVLACDERQPVADYPRGEEGYKIQFKDVSFSYNGKGNNLSDIDFKIKPGQTLGIIGGTGSGKSTIINLMTRFYDCGSGAVYIDGRDVRSFEPAELRRKFGIAFQSDFLYSATVRENVDYFRSLDDAAIKKATACAQADEFIEGLEGGMDYVIAQKANNLSGGQKQRLLIARALAGDPEILVLDDSSSALDYSTDAKLRRALASEYAGCTKVIVAQRISAVKHADLILVLEDGEVVGAGTHEQLMGGCEDYKQIYEAQMGGAS